VHRKRKKRDKSPRAEKKKKSVPEWSEGKSSTLCSFICLENSKLLFGFVVHQGILMRCVLPCQKVQGPLWQGLQSSGLLSFHFKPKSQKKEVWYLSHWTNVPPPLFGWCQDNGNRSNRESKFDFLATRQCQGRFQIQPLADK